MPFWLTQVQGPPSSYLFTVFQLHLQAPACSKTNLHGNQRYQYHLNNYKEMQLIQNLSQMLPRPVAPFGHI